MKIALISPKANFLSKNKEFNSFWSKSKYTSTYRQSWSGISPSLLVIAGLTPEDYKIEIIDENIETIDYSKKYNFVGITAMTQQAIRAYQIADEFRKRDIKVIIGGIHATVLPEEAIKHADSVVVGEVEYLWEEILNDFRSNNLKKFYKSSRRVNLIDSPLPRYDLIEQKKYKTIWIQATRGCPHDCEFCAASTVYGHKVRYKSIEQVINEIENIKDVFGDIRINFGDDNLLVNKKYSIALLERMIPLKIRWATQSDISIAKDDEILELLQKSGCVLLFIGFESLSKDSLKNIDRNNWKYKQLEHYSEYIKKIQSFGIPVMGAFIVGLDGDDKTVFNKIACFANENLLGDIQVAVLTPLPGTRLRQRLEQVGRLLPTKWENYTLANVNIIHPKLTKEEMEDGLFDIYKKINSKEVYLKKMAYFKEIQKKLLKEQK